MSDLIYLCSECGNCFSSETSLQKHDLATHSFLNHVCLVCHNELNNPALLKRHVTAHQNLLHCCNICGELCENKIDVYVHVTTSHKYEGKMVCDLCSKTFSSNSCLKSHSMNKHAEEMPQVLQKWELFCSVHSSRNLCREDVFQDSLYPFDCPLRPNKEKESLDETNSVRSKATKSNQSTLLSETMDDPRRTPDSDCPGSDMTELQTFLQEHGNNESWYTKSTDHISNNIQPNDILDRIQPLTKNKNRLEKDESIKCRLCDTTFSNKNDYRLAHGDQDPSNVYPHKQEEKSVQQSGLQDLIQFCKSTIRNTSHVPSKEFIKELSGSETVVIHEDKNASAENQNGQLKPNGTLLAEISALTSQIQNKNLSDESRKGQLYPNGTPLPEMSALTIQNQNKNANAEN